MIAVVVDGLAPGMSIAITLLAAKVRAAEAARGARHPGFTVSFVEPRRCAAAGSIGRSLRSVRRRDAVARRVAGNVELRGLEFRRRGRRHGRGASDGGQPEPEQELRGAHTAARAAPPEPRSRAARPRPGDGLDCESPGAGCQNVDCTCIHYTSCAPRALGTGGGALDRVWTVSGRTGRAISRRGRPARTPRSSACSCSSAGPRPCRPRAA